MIRWYATQRTQRTPRRRERKENKENKENKEIEIKKYSVAVATSSKCEQRFFRSLIECFIGTD
jgi:hypothetical protein